MTDQGRAGETATKRRVHTHEFSAFWWHFGMFGRQDVHLHSCDCGNVEMVGLGRECDGIFANHVEKKLSSARTHWSDVDNEGKPL